MQQASQTASRSAGGDVQGGGPSVPAASLYSLAIWVVLFQIAWYFRPLMDLIGHGAMPDPDDFLRRLEVENWMAGQGWFDVSVSRLNAPFGAEMHWSRLVDLPIALLAWIIGNVASAETAIRLASAIWPTALLVTQLVTLVLICRRVYPLAGSLAVALFALTNIAALSLFAPGRIDHHNIQILLMFLALLGIMSPASRWGAPIAGSAMALSLYVGLDNLPIIVALLAWLGMSWCLGMEHSRLLLRRSGLSLAIVSILLFPIAIAPAEYLLARCDAVSVVYTTALVLAGVAFVLLSLMPEGASDKSPGARFLLRFAAAIVLAALSASVILYFWPQCIAGPYGEISPELAERWLARIGEAKGILAYGAEFGPATYALPVYLSLILVAGFVIHLRKCATPALLPVLAMLAICLMLGFLQVRAVRIGVFAAVPVCVILADLAWRYFSERRHLARISAMAWTALSCLPLVSAVWLIVASLLLPTPTSSAAGTRPLASADLPAWAREKPVSQICNRQSDFAFLASLPEGIVFNDLNSGPAILVFTAHSVVGGNYHRNGDAILDTLDFFQQGEAEARRIAERRGAVLVAFCLPDPSLPLAQINTSSIGPDSLGSRIISGNAPEWLEQLSPEVDRLRVYRVRH